VTDSTPRRGIRSFVVRAGRITRAQERALVELWPKYVLDWPAPATTPVALPFDLNAVFGRAAPRTLEIGFGNGENLAALAARHPERDYLGAEVHRPGVGSLMLLAEQAHCSNLRIVCHDAVELLQLAIKPDTLDEVLVLFPDPWHKKRHHKRRLIQPAFATLLVSRLRQGGRLHLATDWQDYAEQMLAVLTGEPQLRNLADAGGFVPRPDWRALTRFEKRGHRLGHGVWDLEFIKTG
jgi:tRNA (guanine-N7-)-methyltransferase